MENILNLVICSGAETLTLTPIVSSNPLFIPNTPSNEIINVYTVIQAVQNFIQSVHYFFLNSYLCFKQQRLHQTLMNLGYSLLKSSNNIADIVHFLNSVITIFLENTLDHYIYHAFILLVYDFHNTITNLTLRSWCMSIIAWWLTHKKILPISYNLSLNAYSSQSLDLSTFHLFDYTFPYDSLLIELKQVK